jgi:hypothetical protein
MVVHKSEGTSVTMHGSAAGTRADTSRAEFVSLFVGTATARIRLLSLVRGRADPGTTPPELEYRSNVASTRPGGSFRL